MISLLSFLFAVFHLSTYQIVQYIRIKAELTLVKIVISDTIIKPCRVYYIAFDLCFLK
jgi:hypothetical protein